MNVRPNNSQRIERLHFSNHVHRLTVTITGFGWAERRRVKWRSQPAEAENIQTPVHRFVMRCHNCEHTWTMNDRAIRSAPIVTDQIAGVKHRPAFGRTLISGHCGRVPSSASTPGQSNMIFPAWGQRNDSTAHIRREDLPAQLRHEC